LWFGVGEVAARDAEGGGPVELMRRDGDAATAVGL